MKPLITKHQLWLLKMGIQSPNKQILKKAFLQYYEENMVVQLNYVSGPMAVSNGMMRTVMSSMHKESKATQAAIREKAAKVAPLFNKGGLQLAVPFDDKKIG